MKSFRLFALASCVGAFLVTAACGDDDATVRPRLDAGPETGVANDGEAPDGSGSTCGITLPATYDSPTFETNAAIELQLRKAFDDFLAPMKTVETQIGDGGAPTPITKAQLETLYTAGAPSVKAVTTAYYQARVTAWLTAYEAAITDGTYSPDIPDGGDKGGVYSKWIFDGTGVDLRQAIEKGTFTAGFYNHAIGLTTGTITVGTIDRFVAAFGAHSSFPNNQNAPQNKDVNSAGYAARRDSKEASNPGPYQRFKTAAIKAKASVEAGAICDADRDAALKTMFTEWEKSNYATVIFYFNDIIAKLSGAAPDYAAVLHAYGEAVGFIAGFKTIPQDKRIVTDAQIDSLLQKVFAADGAPIEAYKLKTSSVGAASALQQAMNDIKAIYAFTDAEVEAFKKNN